MEAATESEIQRALRLCVHGAMSEKLDEMEAGEAEVSETSRCSERKQN